MSASGPSGPLVGLGKLRLYFIIYKEMKYRKILIKYNVYLKKYLAAMKI